MAGLAWLAGLLWHGLLASAATVTYDFNVSWVTTNPDGQADRQTIGINGQWPIPTIRVNVGDRLIVNVLNSLEDEATSLHFHGLFMAGAAYMDGPGAVTQCPIPPGERFTYNFTVSVLPARDGQRRHADISRSTNLARIGTTPTSTANIPTACAAL